MAFRLLPLILLLLVAACAPAPAPTPVAAAFAPSRILAPWETVRDTPAAAFVAQPWQFIGNQGDAIELRLEADSAGITLALQGPDGVVIDRGSLIRAALPGDGIYTALVRFAPGETAAYRLGLRYTDRPDPSLPTATPSPSPTPSLTPTATITPSPTPTATPTPVYEPLGELAGRLTSGMPQNGTLDAGGDRQVYLFSGDAGAFVNIRMARVSGALDPSLVLYDPDGLPLASDDNSGDGGAAHIRNVRLPDSGEFIVVALGDGQAGEYRVGLTLSPEREPVTPVIPEPTATAAPTATPEPRNDRLMDHVPVQGRISRPGDFVRYPIVALAGEIFTVGVSPIGGENLRPEIEFYSPQGELVRTASVGSSSAGGDALIPAFEAVESGTYVALVHDEGAATGDFVIAYGLGASREDSFKGDASADTPARGELARRGLRDVWRLYLNRGDVITASVNPQGGAFDPTLEIVAPDGAVLAGDDNSGGGAVPLVNGVTAPVTGAYLARVGGANAASSGPYALVWRYLAAAPTPTPPAATVLLMSADDVVPDRTYVSYPFQGQAGQRIVIRVRASAGSALDPVVALLDASGTELARADDSPGSLNPVLEYHLPAAGTYFVRVDGYQSSGAFDLTVEAVY